MGGPNRIKLTSDLVDFIHRSAKKEVPKRCPGFVDPNDVAQEVCLNLVRNPPRYDPTKGSAKTLLYTVLLRAIYKYATAAADHAERNQQNDEAFGDERMGDLEDQYLSIDHILRFVDSEESRTLCRVFFECDGNYSETARRLGFSDKKVRNRLQMLKPKLLASGFELPAYWTLPPKEG